MMPARDLAALIHYLDLMEPEVRREAEVEVKVKVRAQEKAKPKGASDKIRLGARLSSSARARSL